jgi:hypothetical protein
MSGDAVCGRGHEKINSAIEAAVVQFLSRRKYVELLIKTIPLMIGKWLLSNALIAAAMYQTPPTNAPNVARTSEIAFWSSL